MVAYHFFLSIYRLCFDIITVKILLLYGILKIKEFYFSAISKTFEKSKNQVIYKG